VRPARRTGGWRTEQDGFYLRRSAPGALDFDERCAPRRPNLVDRARHGRRIETRLRHHEGASHAIGGSPHLIAKTPDER